MKKPTKRTLERWNRLAPNGIPRWIRVYDNGGETADRYSCVYTGRYRKRGDDYSSRFMSENPYHPQGVGMFVGDERVIDTNKCGFAPAIGRKCHLGRRIRFLELPMRCQECVLSDYADIWVIDLSWMMHKVRCPQYEMWLRDNKIPYVWVGDSPRAAAEHGGIPSDVEPFDAVVYPRDESTPLIVTTELRNEETIAKMWYWQENIFSRQHKAAFVKLHGDAPLHYDLDGKELYTVKFT